MSLLVLAMGILKFLLCLKLKWHLIREGKSLDCKSQIWRSEFRSSWNKESIFNDPQSSEHP